MAQEHLRHFLRAEVALELGPSVAPGLMWSAAQLPTLENVDPLRPEAIQGGLVLLFSDNSDATIFEASDGNWEGLAAGLCVP